MKALTFCRGALRRLGRPFALQGEEIVRVDGKDYRISSYRLQETPPLPGWEAPAVKRSTLLGVFLVLMAELAIFLYCCIALL